MRILKNLLRTALLVLGLGAFASQAEAKWSYPHNHPDLDWYSIETEHFVVHYPVSKRTREQGNEHYINAEWAARKSSKVLEESWAKMCKEFNYYLKEVVHVVLLDQADDLAGFTVPTFDFVEISANPGGSFYRARGRMEWFSDVLVHEFAHVVSLKANGTLSEGTFAVNMGGLYQDGINDVDTGVSVAIADGDSVFWTEGGAEYWSDNAGYNWWTASRDMNIRMTVLEDRLLEYDEWHSRAGKRDGWNDGERYYQQGYSFALYLRERFGDDTYAKFAEEYAKGWRPDFDSVIEDVLGIDGRTLYNDWVAYLKDKYGTQYDKVRAEGEVVGVDLFAGKDYQFKDPKMRDEWFKGKKKDREDDMEKSGRYNTEPKVSPDGQWWGWNPSYYGLSIQKISSDAIVPVIGSGGPTEPQTVLDMSYKTVGLPNGAGHGWDFVPNQNKAVFTWYESYDKSDFGSVTKTRLEGDGYDWKQIWIADLDQTLTKKLKGGREVETLMPQSFAGAEINTTRVTKPIPNTLRGSDPAVHPDGTRIAYFEYGDGTQNLVTINLDGTEKKHLSKFHDGTWFQRVDWSPDGKQLVVAMFRNYQQNLWLVDADGSNWKPIMVDSWEEQDPNWAADGNIYFSSDNDGIWNIYSYNPESGEYAQLTNVIGGAQSPNITPSGHLLYVNYSGHGWKNTGLTKGQFLNTNATSEFGTDFDLETQQAALDVSEDLSEYAALTTKYKPAKSLMAPFGAPIMRFTGESRSDINIQGGFFGSTQDVVEDHNLFAYTLLGSRSMLYAAYTYQGWYPSIGLQGYGTMLKYDRGLTLDLDENPNTIDDQFLYETKNEQYYWSAGPFIDFPWNDNWSLGFDSAIAEFGIKDSTSTGWERYGVFWQNYLRIQFANGGVRSAINYYGAQAFSGRSIGVDLGHHFSDFVWEGINGVTTDDGMFLDDYQYNTAEVRYTEYIPVPTFGGVPFLKDARDHRHIIAIDTRLGFIDRNVSGFDEFRAGGQHPYYWGRSVDRPNSQFAGYPMSSLSGETMAIANLAYRFPLMYREAHKLGPLFVYGIWAQFGGSAGNLWSFRPPKNPSKFFLDQYNDPVAYDEKDVKREIPFLDDAYKNGNWMLYDAQAEVRVEQRLFNTIGWDSYFRVAYGFNEIRGYGDVDGDGTWNTSDDAYGSSLSTETEKPGPRFSIGLGTGW